MTARDCTGRELKVGQKVAHTDNAHYRGLTVSVVKRVLPKMVELDHRAWTTGSLTRREHGYVAIVEDIQ